MASGKMVIREIKTIVDLHFPHLNTYANSLTDLRKRKEYSAHELIMGAIALFVFKLESRLDYDKKLRDPLFRVNYVSLFNCNPPSSDAIDRFLRQIPTNELEKLSIHLINFLRDKKVLKQYEYVEGMTMLAVDGTGVFTWGDKTPEDILSKVQTRTHKSGTVTNHTNILTAGLTFDIEMAIPILTEWIRKVEDSDDGNQKDLSNQLNAENKEGSKTDPPQKKSKKGEGDVTSAEKEKQDCERNAFYRLADKLNKYCPRTHFCLNADGLYAVEPVMDLCVKNGWDFIIVLKDGNLPSVWKEVNSLLQIKSGFTELFKNSVKDGLQISDHYFWIKDIDYKKQKINWICLESKVFNVKAKTTEKHRFAYITSVEVNPDNIVKLVAAGRGRWNLENCFNNQKNRGYFLHHKFSRSCYNALMNWHALRQIGYTISQLVHHLRSIKAFLRENRKITDKALWEDAVSCMIAHSIDKVMEEYDQWAMKKRQVRLE